MSKNRNPPVSSLPVMAACCATCPFKLVNGFRQDEDLAQKVIERTLFQGQQVCHGTEGPDREWRNRCKGAYDHNLEIYQRMDIDLNQLNEALNGR